MRPLRDILYLAMPMKRVKNSTIYFYLSLAMLFWGMSFIWYKQAYPQFAPVTVVFLRLIISFLLLFCTAFLLKKINLPEKKDIKYFMLLALFEPFLYFIGESFGMKYVSPTLASVIIATIPLISPFISYYFFRERLTRNNYIGILMSFIGVLVVIYVEGQIGEAPWFGILLMLLAVLSTQGYTVVLKRLSEKYSSLTIISIQNLLGIIYFLPLFLLLDAKDFSLRHSTLKDFMPVLYLAVFASTFAFLFFIEGIKKLGIARAVVFTNLIPIVTVVFAFLLLSESITLVKIIGIALTISGLFMSQGNVLKNILDRIKPK
jgi:drug/metabolite transporter (DMT)-like permease